MNIAEKRKNSLTHLDPSLLQFRKDGTGMMVALPKEEINSFIGAIRDEYEKNDEPEPDDLLNDVIRNVNQRMMEGRRPSADVNQMEMRLKELKNSEKWTAVASSLRKRRDIKTRLVSPSPSLDPKLEVRGNLFNMWKALSTKTWSEVESLIQPQLGKNGREPRSWSKVMLDNHEVKVRHNPSKIPSSY
jgi:hypothetical protein